MVFGIDHQVSFTGTTGDTVRQSFLSWGNTTGKDQLPGNLGYLILLKPGTRTGLLSGTLNWDDTHMKGFPDRIRILSGQDTAFNVSVPVDTGGYFSAILPEGSYTITPARSFFRFDNELYKIDLQASAKKVSVINSESNPHVQVFLTTLKKPDLIPDKGLLHDFDQDKARRLDEIIRAYQEYYLIPGVSLALISNGKVIYHRTYGVKNAYTGEPVTDSTLFEAASVTKTVFAFAVNSLAEKGVIDLDKPLYSYLPFDEIAYDDRYKLITARHVLCHQTGLPNWAYNEPDGKLRLKFTPGTGYGYSGEGFEYLKRVIEKITGRDIESVVSEEAIKPIGLEHIYFTGNAYLEKTGATGHYENLPTRTDLPDKPGMAWSMYTEALGFTRFMLALQNREILKPETYNEMFRFQSTVDLDEKEIQEGRDIHYGLGIYLENTPLGFMYGHGGNNGDFQCQYLMFRDMNMGFAIFTNSSTGGPLVHQDMRKILITGNGRMNTGDGR
jgi:CubicO group peptidase (beta-lactamase class C family)